MEFVMMNWVDKREKLRESLLDRPLMNSWASSLTINPLVIPKCPLMSDTSGSWPLTFKS